MWSLVMRLAVGLLLLGASLHTRLGHLRLPRCCTPRPHWHAGRQGIQSYDLAVAVDVRGRQCFQHVRVRRGAALQISDTCAVPTCAPAPLTLRIEPLWFVAVLGG